MSLKDFHADTGSPTQQSDHRLKLLKQKHSLAKKMKGSGNKGVLVDEARRHAHISWGDPRK